MWSGCICSKDVSHISHYGSHELDNMCVLHSVEMTRNIALLLIVAIIYSFHSSFSNSLKLGRKVFCSFPLNVLSLSPLFDIFLYFGLSYIDPQFDLQLVKRSDKLLSWLCAYFHSSEKKNKNLFVMGFLLNQPP